jgi:hypothetical protein
MTGIDLDVLPHAYALSNFDSASSGEEYITDIFIYLKYPAVKY